MNIFVNNIGHFISHPANIKELLLHLKIDNTNGIAIAVNNQVIQKSEWEKYFLNENDKIMLIKATRGG